MRVGIVGTGAMGQTHAHGWTQTPATLAGFASQSAESAAQTAAKFDGRGYRSFEALLADVDVVDICTPTHLHHDMVMAAAAAGKHVVCEKPLARTLADAEAMIAACENAGVSLLIAHVVRFFPEYALAHARVAAGEIGRPAVVRLRRGTYRPTGSGDNWFLDPAKSGGMVLDLMIHDFDYARWVAGPVKTVYARSLSGSGSGQEIDHALVILTHEKGALSHVEGSWAYPPPLFRTQLEIAGENGWLRVDSGETTALSIHLHAVPGQKEAAAVPLPRSPLHESPYTTQIREFYDHLATGAPVRVTARDGLEALRIGLAALESSATGQPITLVRDKEGTL